MTPRCSASHEASGDSSMSTTLRRLLGLARCGACGQPMPRRSIATAPPELVLEAGKGTVWGLTSFPAFLGRSPACVRLKDPLVSRVHARVIVTAQGFVIEDMGSLNGISVDGVRLTSRVLHEGSRIKIGDTELVVRKVAGVASARPAAAPSPAPPLPLPVPRPMVAAPVREPRVARRPEASRDPILGPLVFGSACVVQGALVAALLGLVLFTGSADPLGRLVAALAIGLQSVIALSLTFAAVVSGRMVPELRRA